MLDLNSLIIHNTADKKDKNFTHQYFGSNIVKLQIPFDKQLAFYQSYMDHILTLRKGKAKDSDALSTGLNCFVERTNEPFRMFVDIDFDMDLVVRGKLDFCNIPTIIEEITDSFAVILKEAFALEELPEYAHAFRMAYKCHLYFPKIVVSVEQAKMICAKVQKVLDQTHPDLVGKNIIDVSVYTSGIRMLGSHKGVMGAKKQDTEKKRHVEYFKEHDMDMEYLTYYRLGHIVRKDDGSFDKIQYKELTLKDLLKVSIICDPDTQLSSFSSDFKAETLKRKQTITVDDNPTQKRSKFDTVENVDNLDSQETHKALITEYLQTSLTKYGMQFTKITNMKKDENGSSILINLDAQECPFAKRWHKRSSERNIGCHYVILNAFENSVRCFKCTDASFVLDIPNDELKKHLEDIHPDFHLKRSLYLQTHETISEFIFTLVKDKFAASKGGSGDGGYLWYYYSKRLHRWIEYEKILIATMQEKGIIQLAYNDFLQKTQSSGISQEDVTKLKKLWFMLREHLQNFHFVKGGIIPLLARKLDDYWSSQANGRLSFQSRLDSNPKLLGFTNGVWDFEKSEFRDGRPDDFISLSTQIEFIPYIDYPTEDRQDLECFLSQIFGSQDRVDYTIYQISSALEGSGLQQKFFIWTGTGANGKSTAIRLLNHALGDYAGEVNITLFTKPRPPSNAPLPELIAIKGMRFVSTSEPNAKDEFNLSIIKWLTGNDRITAAQKFQANQSFYLQCTFFCLTNDIPPINASCDDYGTWRRMDPIPFESKFVGNPKLPNEFFPDPLINDKIAKWAPMFMSLLIKTKLDGKPVVKPLDFEKMWLKLQDRNNDFGNFVQSAIKKDEESFCGSIAVYRHYLTYMKELNRQRAIKPYDIFEKHMKNPVNLGPLKQTEDNVSGWFVDLLDINVRNV